MKKLVSHKFIYILSTTNTIITTTTKMPVKQQQQQQQPAMMQQQHPQQSFLVKEEDIDYFFLPTKSRGIMKKYSNFSIEEATNTKKFVYWLVYKKPQVEDVRRIIDVINRFPFSGYDLPNLTEHLNKEVLLHFQCGTYDWLIPVVERLLVAGATPNDLDSHNKDHVIWTQIIDKWETKDYCLSIKMLLLFLDHGLDLNRTFRGQTAVDYAVISAKNLILAAQLSALYNGKHQKSTVDYIQSSLESNASFARLFDIQEILRGGLLCSTDA